MRRWGCKREREDRGREEARARGRDQAKVKNERTSRSRREVEAYNTPNAVQNMQYTLHIYTPTTISCSYRVWLCCCCSCPCCGSCGSHGVVHDCWWCKPCCTVDGPLCKACSPNTTAPNTVLQHNTPNTSSSNADCLIS